MSDSYTYTLAGETLGSARQPLDIIYIPGILAFTASPVRPLHPCQAVHYSTQLPQPYACRPLSVSLEA